MALTDTAIRLARPRERVYRLNEGRGLRVLIQPNRAKWWRFRYRWQGREQMLSMETYRDMPLIEAWKQRDIARGQLARGINPSDEQQKNVILLIGLSGCSEALVSRSAQTGFGR